MASLYNHPKSRYWFIQFRGADGKVHRQSTKILKGSREDRREALQVVAEVTSKELSRSQHSNSHKWDAWVLQFLQPIYAHSPKTLMRYQNCWASMRVFLKENQIDYPSQVRYQHAKEYMVWRKKKGTSHNTARLELILLGMLMDEAVLCGSASSNPITKLSKRGIKKLAAKEKPELIDRDIIDIRAALQKEPEWMQIAFEIALYTGCRLSETRIALKDIDMTRHLITFQKPKGGAERGFTARFSEELMPLFKRLKATERQYTLEFPTATRKYPDVSSNHFHRFFKKKGLKLSDPEITFHSTRVTFITRHERKGTDQRILMRQVNHSSTLVHRIYSRLRPEDVSDDDLKIGLPSSTHNSSPNVKLRAKATSRRS